MAKRSRAIDPEYIMRMVAKEHGSTMKAYQVFRSKAEGRAMAALLCRELTNISLAGLSELFKLGYPNSAANLVRRAKNDIAEQPRTKRMYGRIKKKLNKNEKQRWLRRSSWPSIPSTILDVIATR